MTNEELRQKALAMRGSWFGIDICNYVKWDPINRELIHESIEIKHGSWEKKETK